ncbi:wax ester/triacylglycerol synthase family O-acyltransferase [Rhodococcus sp. G-MC3]|uniref:wax ester/triacylglycerol synthase domain-containing protein n=1 Tax=Rhodococcus sp. G-MC3 TaxID=3046209 RepID=UPI0024BB9792|nr:wax ester/triacylglycerol synthase domain-containing protein [Rhodococcus sp. G-MC3]MDJ0395431.1 wax ester/triacylglycerol synthase family O-acyltransferase [Rhodococcus sp. G-MC3]
MSRLDVIDAAFHYASNQVSRDQYVLLAFDCDGRVEPTFDEISDFIVERAECIPELGKRLLEIPGNLDFPRWIADDASKHSKIVEIFAHTWEDLLRTLDHTVQEPVDTTRAAWRVHVAHDVHGVPHARGKAIVVVFQVSHALVDGRGASRLARLLFSPVPVALEEAPDRLFDPRVRLPVAVGAALALPFRLLRARLSAGKARRACARAQGFTRLDLDISRAGITGNADPTPARAVHVIPCAPKLFDITPLSVTSAALAAVGLATARYLDSVSEPTPTTLNALVPMALPDTARWSAVNRVVNGTVDLHPEVEGLPQRAADIRASLADSRRKVCEPLLIRWISAENLIPAPIFLAVSKRRTRKACTDHTVPKAVQSNVTVISVDRGTSDVELCGAGALFSGGFPMLAPRRSLSHGFYGLGHTVTVCVTACPDTFPDHARYAEILQQAVVDVVEATAERS